MLWPKSTRTRKSVYTLTRTRGGGGGSGSGSGGHINKEVSVNKEYVQAFRTKSYTEIWSKVQGLLQPRSSRSSSSFPLCPPITCYTYLSDYLLEPPQHILMDMIQTANLHKLLIDYFQAGLDASRTCASLLQAIYQTRANYCKIQTVVKLTKRLLPDCAAAHHAVFNDLASFAKLENPLSGFTIIHQRFGSMLNHLAVTRNKVARKARYLHLCKKASTVSLIVACTALAAATFALAIHSLVGIVAAPALLTTPLAFFKFKRNMNKFARRLKTSQLNKIVAQLDAAAKGIYILNRDFDTMSRLVMRLCDEIEHYTTIARLCVSSNKTHMLKEAVKEYHNHESCFLKQLGELEDHVHLCILTINRSRKLVIQEISVDKSST